MYGRSEPQQQWTVHAEFTIKHDGLEDRTVLPQTHTERDENGVRMVYSWGGQQNVAADNRSVKSPSSSASIPERNVRDPQLPYGFQRGNLVFSSTPPSKPCTKSLGLNVQDSRNLSANVPDSSGYSSELLSPNSGSLPYRTLQPYNRRCKSTCSIVLSTDFNQKTDIQSQCGRTQSLRCQTPSVKPERRDSFYGCGDPWCYHSNHGDDCARFPPVQECDEYNTSNSNSKLPSRASTYTGRHSDRTKTSPPKSGSRSKDASVQTFEMIDKCTSPFLRTEYNLKDSDSDAKIKREKNFKKKSSYNSRRKTEPIFQRLHSPSSFTPDSLESQQPTRRIIRTAKISGKSPADIASSDSRSSDPNKKPRTVHIDVYCTGTEQESSSSLSDSENKTASSPQTVFESGKFKLTHKQAESGDLPFNLHTNESNEKVNNVKELKKKFEKDDSDDDGGSTAYPSQLSSFSAMEDFASSLSSVPPSWSTMSVSSCAVPDDDSVANTSWKDTYSDLGSLVESRSSIAQTDSLDFVPRKLLQRDSIEEYPELQKNVTETSSKGSLQPSDSFEYANSEDRFRIRKMEQMWDKGKQWRSPYAERKHLLQQRKLKEYLDKRLSDKSLPKWEAKDSDSEGTDSEEKGWSIVKEEQKSSPRLDTKLDQKKVETPVNKVAINNDSAKKSESKGPTISVTKTKDQGGLSESSPTKQRFSLDPNLRSPFTIVPGIYTEQREVAQRFGRVVDVFKKPGHHVGPAKNPDCACEHCRRHFEIFGMRNRARSWGDSTNTTINWKEAFRGSVPREVVRESHEPGKNMADIGYTDF